MCGFLMCGLGGLNLWIFDVRMRGIGFVDVRIFNVGMRGIGFADVRIFDVRIGKAEWFTDLLS
jgi:hypothetical protein